MNDRLKLENDKLKEQKKNIGKRRNKFISKHNKICIWAGKVYKRNIKLKISIKEWKFIWSQEKYRNRDKEGLRMLVNAMDMI
jgi:hypothetical protein